MKKMQFSDASSQVILGTPKNSFSTGSSEGRDIEKNNVFLTYWKLSETKF